MLSAEDRIYKGFFPYEPGSPDAMIHNDHLATPQKMTDSSGTVVWSADYKPFGEATVTVSTITNNLRFPGQYYDAETGLHQNKWRDYNFTSGRYVESDPLHLGSLSMFRHINPDKAINAYTMAPQRLHLYVYVLNGPIDKIDPTGLSHTHCLAHLLGDLAAHEIPGNDLSPTCGSCVLAKVSTGLGNNKFCIYQCYDDKGNPTNQQIAIQIKTCPPEPCKKNYFLEGGYAY
jgi:RHS repeat-associated protein